MIVKQLPEKFRSRGVHYQQVKRYGDVAIFSLRYGDTSPVIGYDCIKVQSYTLEVRNRLKSLGRDAIPGKPDDVIESYPSSRQWGKAAWSFTSYHAAQEKYWQLVGVEKRKILEQVL